MFIVSKALLISSDTVIVRAGGPFARTPLILCYLVCVVLCTRIVCMCLVYLLLFMKTDLLQCLQLLIGGAWLV